MSEMALDEFKPFTSFNNFAVWPPSIFFFLAKIALPCRRRNCLVREEHHHFQIVVFLELSIERLPEQKPASPEKNCAVPLFESKI